VKKLFTIICLLPIIVYGGTTGKIVGRITDSSTKEPLVGVNITILDTRLGASTDIDGNFVILNIPPGKYKVKVSSVGFKPIVFENVSVVVDRTVELNTELEATAVQVGELVVEARRPLIQKDLTSSISVMSREKIESLPISNFTELLSMQAGVVGNGSSIHVRGGRSNEVAYMIDGMYVQDPLLGGLATQIGNDAIQEMSLLISFTAGITGPPEMNSVFQVPAISTGFAAGS